MRDRKNYHIKWFRQNETQGSIITSYRKSIG